MQLLAIGADTQIVEALSLLCRESHDESCDESSDESHDGCVVIKADKNGLVVKDELERSIDKHCPDFVINASLYPDPLTAEANAKLVDSVNHVMLSDLAGFCNNRNIPLIQMTNTMVFDGKKEGLYDEKDVLQPTTLYGKALVAGEQAIRDSCEQHVILRTGSVFSQWGDNELTRILKVVKDAAPLIVPEGIRSCPTPAADIARVIIAILQQLNCQSNTWGTFHYCSSDATSAHDFADAVLSVLSQHVGGVEKSVTSEALKDDMMPFSYPVNTVMSCKKILHTYGIKQRPWRSGLTAIIKEVYPKLPDVAS